MPAGIGGRRAQAASQSSRKWRPWRSSTETIQMSESSCWRRTNTTTGTNAELAATPDEWLASAQQNAGSWWSDWAQWIAHHAGKSIPARRPGGGRLSPIERRAEGRTSRPGSTESTGTATPRDLRQQCDARRTEYAGQTRLWRGKCPDLSLRRAHPLHPNHARRVVPPAARRGATPRGPSGARDGASCSQPSRKTCERMAE